MYDFKDRVVMVTGSAGNLGMAVAKNFLSAGARLVLVDRSPDRLYKMYPHLVDSPDHYLATSVDLTDTDSVANMVKEVISRFGQVDVLVNTAGGYRAGTPLHETSLETLDFLIDLNIRTVFILSQQVIPIMLNAGYGKIVNIAARPGLSGRANMSAYSVSKSAVLRLTESMAAELKGDGINVNCIIPGTINSPQNREAMPDAKFDRWVEPESLAGVILFLASEMADDIHGIALPVYGLS
jgi:NAD(P)-dependent dehydrogenase (short-subunit alcohol dehydrogenase family)